LSKGDLPFNVFKLLNEQNYLSYCSSDNIIKSFKDEEIQNYVQLMTSSEEKRVLDFVIDTYNQREMKKSIQLSNNTKKLMKLKGCFEESFEINSLTKAMSTINPNLYACMIGIYDSNFSIEVINSLLSSELFDELMKFVIYLDDINLVQKLIPKDDLYVKLKYYYKINNTTSNIGQFLSKIDKDRQMDKIKVNKILRNSDDHVNALNEGELKENYVRCENVFGMTPEDNIISKMLLLFNKVYNKKEALNDKDIATLKTMRKSIYNIKRNEEFVPVEEDYFYSLDLHYLFFNKKEIEQTKNEPSINHLNDKESKETVKEATEESDDGFEMIEKDVDNELEEDSEDVYSDNEDSDENSDEESDKKQVPGNQPNSEPKPKTKKQVYDSDEYSDENSDENSDEDSDKKQVPGNLPKSEPNSKTKKQVYVSDDSDDDSN
jgi:hypothetical protein